MRRLHLLEGHYDNLGRYNISGTEAMRAFIIEVNNYTYNNLNNILQNMDISEVEGILSEEGIAMLNEYLANEEREIEKFVIEDYYIRMCLENELKKHGDTFEYRNNTEKVEIRKETLIKLLTSYNEELSKTIKTQALLKALVGLIPQFTEKLDTYVVLFEQLKDVGSKILKEIKK